jgi:hypothetical protein
MRPPKSSLSKRSCFENSLAVNRDRVIPLFFDQGVAAPQFLSDESTDEIWKSFLQAAGDSGIDPAIVYAMNKTGRIVTETNVHFLADAELQEWMTLWMGTTRRLKQERPNRKCFPPKTAM